MTLKQFLMPGKLKILIALAVFLVIPLPQTTAVCTFTLQPGVDPCKTSTEWNIASAPMMMWDYASKASKYSSTQLANMGVNQQWYKKFFGKLALAVLISYLLSCLSVHIIHIHKRGRK